MPYPDEATNWVDGITELEAWWFNAIEAWCGFTGGATVPGSLAYKLMNPLSLSPGHRHAIGDLYGGKDGDIVWYDPADDTWKHVDPDTAGIVAKTGNQTIDGVKTFSSIPEGPASDPTTDNQLVRKAYIPTALLAFLNGTYAQRYTISPHKSGTTVVNDAKVTADTIALITKQGAVCPDAYHSPSKNVAGVSFTIDHEVPSDLSPPLTVWVIYNGGTAITVTTTTTTSTSSTTTTTT